MKPKKNYTPGVMDNCQTPYYALRPLLQYLPRRLHFYWESAAGEGYLEVAMRAAGLQTYGTDILRSPLHDFFTFEPAMWDAQLTNPPFGLKFKWLKRSYELGKPFALLLPVETLGSAKAQLLFAQYGMQVLLLDQRVDFKMPTKGWGGASQFPTCWITWNIGLPEQIVYGHIEGKKEWQNSIASELATEPSTSIPKPAALATEPLSSRPA